MLQNNEVYMGGVQHNYTEQHIRRHAKACFESKHYSSGLFAPTYYNVLLQNKLKVVQQGGKVCKHGSSEGRNKNKLKERVNQSVASCQLNFVIDRSVKYQRA